MGGRLTERTGQRLGPDGARADRGGQVDSGDGVAGVGGGGGARFVTRGCEAPLYLVFA